jgi:integrase
MRVSNAADAPAGPCSLPPLAHLVPGQETLARPSVPADCERRQENSGETKAVPRTAVQRLLSRRDIPLREKTLRRMLYETAARAAEILEIDVQDLDLDNRQAPIRSQRRRDPMGVLGHRHRPPAPALAAPARRHFSYERTAVPVRTQSVPARRPAPRHICPHTGRARLGYDRCRVLLDHYAGLELHQLRHSAATQ